MAFKVKDDVRCAGKVTAWRKGAASKALFSWLFTFLEVHLNCSTVKPLTGDSKPQPHLVVTETSFGRRIGRTTDVIVQRDNAKNYWNWV